jgi:hypothetical protein
MSGDNEVVFLEEDNEQINQAQQHKYDGSEYLKMHFMI